MCLGVQYFKQQLKSTFFCFFQQGVYIVLVSDHTVKLMIIGRSYHVVTFLNKQFHYNMVGHSFHEAQTPKSKVATKSVHENTHLFDPHWVKA